MPTKFSFNALTGNLDLVDAQLFGSATLVGGTVTVSLPQVTANSDIFLTGQNSSGTAGNLTVSSRTAGTSFTITSSSASDTRTVAWLLYEPAAAIVPSRTYGILLAIPIT